MSHAAKKKAEQRQRKRSGGIMLPHMFVMNKVALAEALIFDGLLDEGDGEDRDAIAKAVEDLLWFYANEERPIAVGRPKYYRTGLLDRQGFDAGDTWELIKKEFKRESKSENYVVVLSRRLPSMRSFSRRLRRPTVKPLSTALGNFLATLETTYGPRLRSAR